MRSRRFVLMIWPMVVDYKRTPPLAGCYSAVAVVPATRVSGACLRTPPYPVTTGTEYGIACANPAINKCTSHFLFSFPSSYAPATPYPRLSGKMSYRGPNAEGKTALLHINVICPPQSHPPTRVALPKAESSSKAAKARPDTTKRASNIEYLRCLGRCWAARPASQPGLV